MIYVIICLSVKCSKNIITTINNFILLFMLDHGIQVV
jgi:hypothetical protein